MSVDTNTTTAPGGRGGDTPDAADLDAASIGAAVAIGLVVVAVASLWMTRRFDDLDGSLFVLVAVGLVATLISAVVGAATLRSASPGSAPADGSPVFSTPPAAVSSPQAEQSSPAPPRRSKERSVRPGEPLTLSIPKIGSTDDECEDAAGARWNEYRYAVADGASSSYGSRPWAQQLVAGFLGQPPGHGSLSEVSAWVNEQRQALARHAAQPPAGSGTGWWADEGSRRGAFATLLGVTVARDRRGGVVWQSVAVGDSCLLHVQLEPSFRVMASFPVDVGAKFGSHPSLVHSTENDEPLHGVRWASGALRPGEVLLLMTDAVSEWALADAANVADLVALDQGALAARLTAERSAGKIVNDDLSVVRTVFKEQLR
jgi:hypothetical protein